MGDQNVTGAVRALQLLTAGSLAVPLIVLLGGGWLAHEATIERAKSNLVRTVTVAEEHAIKVLDTHRLVSARVNDLVRNLDDDAIPRDERSVHDQIVQAISGLAQVHTVLVIGRSGRLLVSSRGYPVDHSIDFSQRDYFRALQAPGEDLHVSMGETDRPRQDGQLIVARRRESAPGQFDGAIVTTVPPRYFMSFYGKLVDRGRDYSAALFRQDGVTLARYPAVVPSASPVLLMAAVRRQPQGGIAQGVGGIEGVERIIAYRKLDNYPVFATVGRPWSSVLREWRETVLTHLYFGAPASLGLMLLCLVALRRARREEIALLNAREAVRQRAAAEDALRQAQKMETVGQLTGGIAHDFSNLLTVIIGNLEMARRDVESWTHGSEERLRRTVDSAMRGAQRAAALTQRLLAFSRRQPLDPKPIDVNRLLTELTDFIRRSLGETIALKIAPADGLWPTSADPLQLEATILNLALNARDAMPDGGTLTVETGNVVLDERYCGRHDEVSPGPYVQISVSDSGAGMTPEVLKRAFEPFFTTKIAGQGTGLGLSQAYGFVKQSGGHITISSEPGQGTTVSIYLPRLAAEAPAETSSASEAPREGRAAAAAGKA